MNCWYARYPGDYLRDTAHLLLTEHGAYGLLLDHYYSTEGPLPASRDALYRICRAFTDAERAAVDSVLAQFFTLQSEGYRNARADRELKKRAEKRRKLSDAGRRRWGKGTMGEEAKAKPEHKPGTSQAIARPQPHPQPGPETACASHTSPQAGGVCLEVASIWNAGRGTLPEVLRLTKDRERRIRSRIQSDSQFPQKLKAALERATRTPFLCGGGERHWKANFDWFIANDTNCVAVLEGKYDDGKGGLTRADQQTVANLEATGTAAN
ncbi:MAG: YdaU family protein [Candidatus Sulfotelmatobacter sp.]